MPARCYKRKTVRGSSIDVLERAHERYKVCGSIRAAAAEFSVDKMTLLRFIKARTDDPNAKFGYTKCKDAAMIFTKDMDLELGEHIKNMAQRFHGLSKEKVLQLAYQFAKANNRKMPKSWENNKKAGQTFWINFKTRNHLSVRTPEATSLARMTAFNRHNVHSFFKNLAQILDRHKFEPKDIYNLDETGVRTVQDPGRVVSSKGLKQVGSVTPAERGELVTVVYAICASGTVLPPMFIFPRVRYHDHFIRGAPNNSIGTSNPSGWINEEKFLLFLDHFIAQTRCSKDNPVLLIMDNHDSHINLQAIDKAKEMGIVLLTIPPHTSHKLQPLDKTCYGPFKTAINRSFDNWMRSNPGKTITIYEIPQLVTFAHNLSFTPGNITSGFSSTGIYPFNSDVFTDLDFAPSLVTDRNQEGFHEAHERYTVGDPHAGSLSVSVPLLPAAGPSNGAHTTFTASSSVAVPLSSGAGPSNVADPPSTASSSFADLPPTASSSVAVPLSPVAGPSNVADPPSTSPSSSGVTVPLLTTSSVSTTLSTAPVISLSASIEPLTVVIDTSQTPCDNNSSQSLYVSPTDLHPLPQAGPRKITNRNRKKGSTKILTDTPERDIIAQSKKSKKSRKPPAPKKIRKSLFTKKQKLPTHSDTSESDSDTNSISFDDLSDIDEPNDLDIIEGDFVIIKVSGKSRFQNFIARVDIIDDIEYEGVFLKKVLRRI